MQLLVYSLRVKTRAISLYDKGLSCRAVAARMKAEGLPMPHFVTVLRWARATGKGRRQHGRRLPLRGEDLRPAYDAGASVRDLANRFGVGTTTVYKRLAEAGTKMRPSRIKYGHILAEQRLRQLYWEKEWRAQDIAREVQCDTGTVYNWLNRNNIALKRPRRTRGPKPYK